MDSSSAFREGREVFKIFASSAHECPSYKRVGGWAQTESTGVLTAGKYLFASNPVNDEILAYDVETGRYVDGFFEKNDTLHYPTDLTLTPDGNYILIINYGENTISRFTISGEFDKLFVNPGHDGLTELRDIIFGQDGNLYVIGGVYGEIFKYDGTTGDFLGEYDSGGYSLGELNEDLS